MKKLTILAMFLLMALPLIAQNNTENCFRHNQRGWQLLVDAGINVDVDPSDPISPGNYASDRLSLSGIGGFRFNPRFFAGVGAEFNYYHTPSRTAVPVFGMIKVNFLKGRVSPYVDCRIGYSLGEIEGFMTEPSVGVRVGIANGHAINCGLAFTYIKNESDRTKYADDRLASIGLRVGYEF